MIEKTKLMITTVSGNLDPLGPVQFIEKYVRRNIGVYREVSTDDVVVFDGIETGSFNTDDEMPIQFRKKQLKLKEIFDTDLLTEAAEHRQYRDTAITHFGIQELQRFNKKLKPAIREIEGDLTLDHIHDLAIKYLEECGGDDGKLIWMKNSVLIASPEDFTLELAQVYKRHKQSRMMCGTLFCSRPSRVVKAYYTGRVSLK